MAKLSKSGLTLVVALTMVHPICAQQPQRPQLPLSYQHVQELKKNPAEAEQLGKTLAPVAAEPGPAPAPPIKAAAGLAPNAFSREQAPEGSWSNLSNVPPGGPYNFGNPLLLTDGTVIIHRTDTSDWYKLTPNASGSYVDGTWMKIASMQSGYGPKFFASAVLPDGRVIAEGGEYNMGGAADWGVKGSIYDPMAGPTGTWTAVAPPAGWTTIGDSQSTVLANGTFMMSSCCDIPFKAALLNPGNLTWTITGKNKADRYDEESWSLLPDNSVLTVDAYTTPIGGTACGLGSERYNAANGSWSSAGNVPKQLSDCNNANTQGGSSPSFEIGPQVLMYNGKVIVFGGTTANVAHTAIYDTHNNAWSGGPDLPSTCTLNATDGSVKRNMPCTLADAPATLLPNGKVLFVASVGKFNTPANFFEYDPATNTIVDAPGTSDADKITSFYVNFLTLPTGQTLAVETYTSTIQIYTPTGTYQAAWQPVITAVPNCVSPGGSYKISGKQLNGLSQTANYGDDQQAATNYPLVRIVNNDTGHVFYARTSGHSTMAVTPNLPGSTNFKVATNTEVGPSKLYVVANGIPSAAKDVRVMASGCPAVETAMTGQK